MTRLRKQLMINEMLFIAIIKISIKEKNRNFFNKHYDFFSEYFGISDKVADLIKERVKKLI